MKRLIIFLVFVLVCTSNYAQTFKYSTKQENVIQCKYKLEGTKLIPDGVDKESSIIGKDIKSNSTFEITFDDYISIQATDGNGQLLFLLDDIELIDYAIEHPSFEIKEIGLDIYNKAKDNQLGTIWISPNEITIWHSPEDAYFFEDRFRQCYLMNPDSNMLKNNQLSYEKLKKELKNYQGNTRLVPIE